MTVQPPRPEERPRPRPQPPGGPRQPNPRPQAPPVPPTPQAMQAGSRQTTPVAAQSQPTMPAPQPEPISPQPQQDRDPRKPIHVVYPIPVATTEFLPGREIVTVLGLVIGVSTRPRDMAYNPEMGYINTAARQDAVGAMVQLAMEAGADAVVGVRFDGGKISETVTELTAYGTAVKLRA